MEIASVLFAAGSGRRLRPLTDTIPKPVLPLLDVPLGAFALAGLASSSPVLVNVSHLPALVVDALEPYGAFEMLNETPAPYGTAGTLGALIDRLAETFVTLNSDSFSDLNPDDVRAVHEKTGVPATIAVRAVTHAADVQSVGGRVTRFVDRRREPLVAGFQFLGLAVFERDAIEKLDLPRPGGLGEHLLAPLAATNELHTFEHTGYYTDVGTPRRYLEANLDLLNGAGPSIPGGATGHVIDVGAGRAYVGADASVGYESLGAGTVVLANARVAEGARLERVLVMPGEAVPAVTLCDAIWHGGQALHVGDS